MLPIPTRKVVTQIYPTASAQLVPEDFSSLILFTSKKYKMSKLVSSYKFNYNYL